MTIASFQVEGIGARVYAPEGPYGSIATGLFPTPSYRPGFVVGGDFESEFVFCLFNCLTAGLTINQGDVMIEDNTGFVVQSATGSGAHPFSASAFTAFFGGRSGDPAAWPNPGNAWSYTFPAVGLYGMWCQRAGNSALNCATVNAQTKPVNTTAVAGQVNAPTTPLASSMGLTGMNAAPSSRTFTATTVSGSPNLSAASTTKGVNIGQTLSGTGIPNGTYIKDIQGPVIVMSAAATANGSGVTITAADLVTWGTTVSGSPTITGVGNIPSIFPNATLTGTGVAGLTILSITGVPGNYTINLSGNASANGTVALTASVYIEAMLRWPQVTVQN